MAQVMYACAYDYHCLRRWVSKGPKVCVCVCVCGWVRACACACACVLAYLAGSHIDTCFIHML